MGESLGKERSPWKAGSVMIHDWMLPCGSREAILTVRSYEGGIVSGFLQHPRLHERAELQSLSQMILLLDDLLELESCPNRPLPLVRREFDDGESIAVFRIQIFFRSHHTWQGKLIRQDAKKEFIFRSALELLQLLDEILA